MLESLLNNGNFQIIRTDSKQYIENDGCYENKTAWVFYTDDDDTFCLDKNFHIIKNGEKDGIWEIINFGNSIKIIQERFM